jgi:hypothetical protein
MTTEDDEFNARVEAELNAAIDRELQAEMAHKRAEIAFRLRREAAAKEYDRINARCPAQDKYTGLTREQHEARLREMDKRARADMASMDASNARVVSGTLKAQRVAKAGGGAGFKIR